MGESITDYLKSQSIKPLLIQGDAKQVLSKIPCNSIDTVITSPPYYMKREYLAGGIGLEDTPEEYINHLVSICYEIHRILKPTGSFWLNIGDSYKNKCLQLIPQRVAVKLTDEVGFILRNQVVWNKLKGSPDNAKDKMRSLWEPVFFFTKSPILFGNSQVETKAHFQHVHNV